MNPNNIDQSKLEGGPQWLNTAEAAIFLGVKVNWLTKRRMKHYVGDAGPKYMKLGGTVLYKKSDLEAFVEENTVNPEAD